MSNRWRSFANLPAGLQPQDMLLMTDGSVLVHQLQGANWWLLTPDRNGSYLSGSWSKNPFPMSTNRLYYASGVLRDGRVFILGGEKAGTGDASGTGDIFDPATKTWSIMNTPFSSWLTSDIVSCILEDGRVLFGASASNRTALWDPDTNTWTEAGLSFGAATFPTKNGNTNEETWALLPDGNVMTVEIANPNSTEKYVPSKDQWVADNPTPQTLVLSSLFDTATSANVNISEIGPALFLPNGKLFFVGGTGHTALYNLPPLGNPAARGAWVNGPDLPADTSGNTFNSANGNIQTVIDGPGCVIPNGSVLVVSGDTAREPDSTGVHFWSANSRILLFDPNANTITKMAQQPASASSVDTWRTNLLVLPSSEVLFSTGQSSLEIWLPDANLATPQSAWRPTLTSFPTVMLVGHTYSVSGTQFNGLSQAVSYGDDGQMATNYPIFRLKNGPSPFATEIHYLKSFDFSSMGIATGSAIQSATIRVLDDVPAGMWDLEVIANGIASSTASRVQIVRFDCFMITDRNSFGQGEVHSLLLQDGVPAIFPSALYVVLEGLKPSELGLTTVNLSSPPNLPVISTGVPNFSYQFTGSVIPGLQSLLEVPQRFTFIFNASFQDETAFDFRATTSRTLFLGARISAAGTNLSCSATVDLIKNPNPYILHGDLARGFQWYESIDIRVMQLTANETKFGVTVARTGNASQIATSYIQQVLANLNADPGPGGVLFERLPEAENTSPLSIAPTNSAGVPIYNFAVARARLHDTVAANNVRCFFRMWPGAQTNAAYNPSTLYRSFSDGTGRKIPLLGTIGSVITTIPFFASERINYATASMKSQTDDINVRSISASRLGESTAFFGCWLDINQPSSQILPSRLVGPNPANLPDGPFGGLGPLLSIQQLVRSRHQCIVAEIEYDPDPIPTGRDPSNSDKLAQRNLTFVGVPNPGLRGSRLAPQTFEIRATPPPLAKQNMFDELLIVWPSLMPAGSRGTLYVPSSSAKQILKTADMLYGAHQLKAIDDATIGFPVGGLTYIPVLAGSSLGAAADIPGLLTVELPLGIKDGQQFPIVVKQVTAAMHRGRRRILDEAPTTPTIFAAASSEELLAGAETHHGSSSSAVSSPLKLQPDEVVPFRRVLGAFRMTIPVSTKTALLPEEGRLLSVLRWIEKSIVPDDRWFLVFRRYVEVVAGRFQDMGGDPTRVVADSNGDGYPVDESGINANDENCHIGSLCEIVYDKGGFLEGFVLKVEGRKKTGMRRRAFRCRGEDDRLEKRLLEIWKLKDVICMVCTDKEDPDCVLRIALLRRGRRSREESSDDE